MNSLVLTTKSDLSAHLFEPFAEVKFLEYIDEIERDYEVIYLRDPFNVKDTMLDLFKLKINHLLQNQPAVYIDGVKNFSDTYDYEDKWRQWENFGASLMPQTWQADYERSKNAETIAKKRISTRSRAVVAEIPEDADLSEWILQNKVDIEEEIRVYVIGDRVFPIVMLKTSKFQGGKVKVFGTRNITDEEAAFTRKCLRRIPRIDFVGFDIARDKNNKLFLIEANRSPQFVSWEKKHSIDMANDLQKLFASKL